MTLVSWRGRVRARALCCLDACIRAAARCARSQPAPAAAPHAAPSRLASPSNPARPLTYDSQRSTHSYCRCPCGRTSTLGVLTGIIVVSRRRGPAPPRLCEQVGCGAAAAAAAALAPAQEASPRLLLQLLLRRRLCLLAGHAAASSRAPADVDLLAGGLPEALWPLLADLLQLPCVRSAAATQRSAGLAAAAAHGLHRSSRQQAAAAAGPQPAAHLPT